MKLANEMMEHMEAEPCVEDLKNEIERLKRENETLRENYAKDMGKTTAVAHIGILALSALNTVKAVLSVGKMPSANMFDVVGEKELVARIVDMEEAAKNCLGNIGHCNPITPPVGLVMSLLDNLKLGNVVSALKMNDHNIKNEEDAKRLLDSLPSHNCQILRKVRQ